MPNWNQLLDELKRSPSAQDVLRRRHLEEVHRITGRNVIAYYSGWLQKGAVSGVEINDDDKNGFMSVVHEMDRSLGYARHLSADRCREMGLKIKNLEDHDDLQESSLSFHHSCMLTLGTTGAIKIIENHKGVAFVRAAPASAPAGHPLATEQEGHGPAPVP